MSRGLGDVYKRQPLHRPRRGEHLPGSHSLRKRVKEGLELESRLLPQSRLPFILTCFGACGWSLTGVSMARPGSSSAGRVPSPALGRSEVSVTISQSGVALGGKHWHGQNILKLLSGTTRKRALGQPTYLCVPQFPHLDKEVRMECEDVLEHSLIFCVKEMFTTLLLVVTFPPPTAGGRGGLRPAPGTVKLSCAWG